MLKVNFWLKRLIKEWLFLSSTIGLIITSIYLKRIPAYTIGDAEILTVIFLFLVVLKGLENTQILTKLAQSTIKGRFIPLKIILLTALLSAFFTNDIALLMLIPLTLSLNIKHKDILVILQAIAANAGSAILPSGNPQNMFIYWFYKPSLTEFVKTIYPFSLFGVSLLAVFCLFIKPDSESKRINPEIKPNYKAYIILLFLMLAIILKILPLWLGLVVLVYAAVFDREALKVDYFLIGIFFAFFGLTDNLRHLISVSSNFKDSVVVFSSFLSQLISNVPATLFLADFTADWKRLLWGVSIGGYGNLIGSLANLIAYRIYKTHNPEHKGFLVEFLVLGYLWFFASILFYMFVVS